VLDGYAYNPGDAEKGKMTHGVCMQVCNDRGYKYAGLEAGYQCFCGDTLNPDLTPLEGCKYPCEGDATQTCGGYWQMQVLNYTCSGVPDGGAPMALITPCKNEELNNYKWTWNYADLTNRFVGSKICMTEWDGHCLAAEADHEHARLVVARNGDYWYYNEEGKYIARLYFAPEMGLAEESYHISINCAFKEGCLHDGANLFVQRPSVPQGDNTKILIMQGDTPPYEDNIGFLETMVSRAALGQNHQCISMGCFQRGQGMANTGGNCAIFQDLPDAMACQKYCQDVGCCEYWTYHTDSK